MSDRTGGTGTPKSGSGNAANDASHDAATVPVVSAAARSRKIPKVDPGLATVTASALALIGTIVTVSLRSGGGDSSTPAGNANTIAASAAPASNAGATVADPTGDPGSPGGLAADPSVRMIEQLSGAERTDAEAVMAELLELSKRLPLMVEDDFADNDYQWPLGTNDSAGAGTTCAWSLEGGYRTDLHSGATPGAWCSAGLAKTAQDFMVTMDAALQGTSDSEVGLLFRVSGATHYSLRYRPLTQTISLTHVDAQGPTPILRSTAATAIERSGSNRLTLVVNGATIAAFINDQPVLLVENEARIAQAGAVQVLLQLNEPDTDESLVATRFEMRGS